MARKGSETTILIAGAGPVGLLAAALLVRSSVADGLRVHVVESGAAPEWNAAETDLRVYALSRASQRILERIGVWDAIVAARACPYERMRVFEGADPHGLASIGFDAADIGEPDLGHIVEDRLLRSVLARALGPRATVATGTRVAAVAQRGGRVEVELSSGESLRADLLVAADGGDSQVRSLLGLSTVGHRYGQQAIVAHVGSARPHAHTAWQRFLPGGPLAFLPLADGRSSVVWSLPEAEARAMLAAADGAFVAALERASAGVLGALGPVSARAAFPLKVTHALRYCCSRGVLIGDAAHSVHPLAGQGMNLGLADAACLAAEIDEAVRGGEHPGDLRTLRRYERRRKAANLRMLLALDALHRLFGLPAWAAPLRAVGLKGVDSAPPLKRRLMREALGLVRDETAPWQPRPVA